MGTIEGARKRYGDPIERFIRCIRPQESGCWFFAGNDAGKGYMHFTMARKNYLAHRFSYELFVGPIPEGLVIDHLCRTRDCVNPDHLEPVTIRENLMRGDTRARANIEKTHCPHGHPYAGENLGFQSNGARLCRACACLSASRARRKKAGK